MGKKERSEEHIPKIWKYLHISLELEERLCPKQQHVKMILRSKIVKLVLKFIICIISRPFLLLLPLPPFFRFPYCFKTRCHNSKSLTVLSLFHQFWVQHLSLLTELLIEPWQYGQDNALVPIQVTFQGHSSSGSSVSCIAHANTWKNNRFCAEQWTCYRNELSICNQFKIQT